MIRYIEDETRRAAIAREILEALPEWFEVEEGREGLIKESTENPVFAAFETREDADSDNGRAIGFITIKETGKDTVEIAAMGVRKECHGSGIGTRLFEAARDYAVQKGYSFMQVKTVREGMYEDYDKTNRFYRSVGFSELEVIEDLWDADNPCQIYVMGLKSAVNTILTRHSYRGAYSSEAVPRTDLETIARTGIGAPSGCNKQTTEIVVVDDAATLDQIKAVIDPPVAATAPAMIVVLTRRINAYRDRCFAVQDYSAAIENMLLAMVELGYQSCWYEGHITDEDRICDKIASILGVPDDLDVVCLLPVGKAVDEFHAPSKRPFAERVKFNKWSES